MFFYRVCLLLISFWTFQGFGQEIDSLLLVKKNQFLVDLVRRPGSISLNDASPNSIAIVRSQKLKQRGQHLIKSNDHLYLHFAGGGLLYQLQAFNQSDTLLVFKRLDKTENDGYNFAAFLFASGNELYNIGGYGFWKSNGTLRKFNQNDREWDVAPVNEEIFLPGNATLNWFDPQSKILYTPFQQKVNTGLKEKVQKNQLIKEVYALDLKNTDWKLLGKTNDKAYELLQNSSTHTATNHGLIIATEDDVYLVNYDSNKIYQFHNSSYSQSLSRISNEYLRYYYQGKIYLLNTTNRLYDSLKVDQQAFTKTSFPIWEKDYQQLWYISGILLVIMAIVLLLIRFLRKKKMPIYQLEPGASPIKINFTETERSLIKLLLEKYREGNTATIQEINYVLGTKDKNMGMQKKVRSDVINNINEKYSYLSQDSAHLIQSFRSETDKRYFEYLIKKEQASAITKWMTLD